MISEELKNKFSKIKLLVTDFDGVMTSGHVYVDENGKEMVSCSRKDGLGVQMLAKNNIGIVVISKEINPVVSIRCKKLKIDCWQAIKDSEGKSEVLERIMQDKNLNKDEVAYIGDDLNDMAVFDKVGIAITVSDGHNKIKGMCDYITLAKGGEHAVREVCEIILSSKNIDLEF